MPISSPGFETQPKPLSTSANTKFEITAEDAFSLIASGETQLLDVRSETEYQAGAIPKAINSPILRNHERVEVGITYKSRGKISAIAIGQELTNKDRTDRIKDWKNILKSSKTPALYCARGGLRSIISQNWLLEDNCTVYRVRSGYKALRRYALDTLEKPFPAIIIGGLTGSGKTMFLGNLANTDSNFSYRYINLEKLANHRGSAFGKNYSSPQPRQANFENELALEIFQKHHKFKSSPPTIFFEDESKTIGKIRIPNSFYKNLAQAPLLFLEVSLEERIQNILKDYIEIPLSQYSKKVVLQNLGSSLFAIAPKLGDERFRKANNYLLQEDYSSWVNLLLKEYYDPMYYFATQKKSRKILASGSANIIKTYIQNTLL